MPVAPQWDALILAGGTSRRMGQDKAQIRIGGTTLLERTVLALESLPGRSSAKVIVSGTRSNHEHLTAEFCQEDPPFSGPVAALQAALPFLTVEWMLVLPCDLVEPGRAAEALLTACTTTLNSPDSERLPDAFIARDTEGHVQWLTACVRVARLRDALNALDTTDAPVRVIFEHLSIQPVPAPTEHPQIWDDMDTPEDVARAQQEES